MLDAGAGMHFPGVVFALLGGFHSIGLEIDTARCAMAAHFLQNIVVEFPDMKVAFYNQDITVTGNWSNILIFYFWDKVSASFSIACGVLSIRSHYHLPCVALGIYPRRCCGLLQKHPQVYGSRCPFDSEPCPLGSLRRNHEHVF
jgi:hypothetical protein